MMEKLAKVVDGLDSYFGIDSRMVVDPFATIFNMTEKQALDLASTNFLNLNGEQYPMSSIEHLPASFYDEVFGDEFSNMVVDDAGKVDTGKLAELVATLPLPEKKVLARYLDQALASESPSVER